LVAFDHTAAVGLRGFRLNHCPVSNLCEATMFTMWTILALYLVGGLWRPLRFLGAFASPVLFRDWGFRADARQDTPHGVNPELRVIQPARGDRGPVLAPSG
jgi:hypothetical protein